MLFRSCNSGDCSDAEPSEKSGAKDLSLGNAVGIYSAVAADTGGAILGRHVDVYRPPPASAADGGRLFSAERVYVIPPGARARPKAKTAPGKPGAKVPPGSAQAPASSASTILSSSSTTPSIRPASTTSIGSRKAPRTNGRPGAAT